MESFEHEFFKDDEVLVTQSRFICDGKTYAIRNISSVTMFTKAGEYNAFVIILLIGFSIVMMFAGSNMFFIIPLPIIILYIIFGRSKNEYVVKINSNSGESNALVSLDKEYVESVVNALNESIIFRG